MKKLIVPAICFLTASLAQNAWAQDVRDQTSLVTGKAELVFADANPQDVATRVKEAISQFAIPGNLNFRSLPSDVSPWPDQPSIKQIFFRGAPLVEYHCPTAYAEVTKSPPPVSNAFFFVKELTQICLYSFQRGVKAYVIFNRVKRTESLTSGLFGGIANAIQGTDEERITKQLQETIDTIKKQIPAVLVARIEVPGKPLQEPDKTAVAALIPAKPAVVATGTLAGGQLAVQPTATGIAPPVATPQQVKVEARKNLNAMGMTYHSHEQFLAAIRRKDDVAVQLFLDGGGIDLNQKETSGKTPLEMATEIGATDIVGLIQSKLAPKPTSPTATLAPTTAVPSKEMGSNPPELSPEISEAIDKVLAEQNLSPEQKEAARANMARQLEQIKAFADRMTKN